MNDNERLMRFAEVSAKVGLGRTAIYERISKGTFPEPVKIGRASRWVGSEIDDWVARFARTVPLTDPGLRRALRLD